MLCGTWRGGGKRAKRHRPDTHTHTHTHIFHSGVGSASVSTQQQQQRSSRETLPAGGQEDRKHQKQELDCVLQRALHAASRIWFHGRNASKIDIFKKKSFTFCIQQKKVKKYINRMKTLPSGDASEGRSQVHTAQHHQRAAADAGDWRDEEDMKQKRNNSQTRQEIDFFPPMGPS